jgi:hypothetical protein
MTKAKFKKKKKKVELYLRRVKKLCLDCAMGSEETVCSKVLAEL